MATATVVFSGPGFNPITGGTAPNFTYQNYAEFTTSFRPPSNISGRSCYLKVTNICCMARGADEQNVQLDEFNTYFLTCDLPQPYSFASINDTTDALTGTMINRLGRNKVVAVFMTGGAIKADATQWVFAPAEANLLGQSRILVEIPNGPQTITFQLWKATEKMTQELNSMTIVCEITPIDTGVSPDLPI